MKGFRLLIGIMSCLLFVGCGGVQIPDIPDKIIIERAIRIDDSSGGFQKKITITDRETILQIVDELRSAYKKIFSMGAKCAGCGTIILDYGDRRAPIEIRYYCDRRIKTAEGETYYVRENGWIDKEIRRYINEDVEDD